MPSNHPAEPPEPDSTEQFPGPEGSGDTEQLPVPDGDTEQLGTAGTADDTRQFPAGEEPTGAGGADPAETGPVPPAAWSGRAAVRPPGMAGDDPGEPVTEEWDGPPAPARRWWPPVLLGLLALVLVGALGAGIYLIVQALSGDEPAPAVPSGSPTVTESPTDPPQTRTAAPPQSPDPAPPEPPEPPPGSPDPTEPPSNPPPSSPPEPSSEPPPTTRSAPSTSTSSP